MNVFSQLPTATYIATEANSTGLPLAPGTRSDCNNYIDGSDFQFGTGNAAVSACETVTEFWGISPVDFGFWNPSLGNVSSLNCTLDVSYSYCTILVDAPVPVIDNPPAVPIRVETIAFRISPRLKSTLADSWLLVGR